MDLGEGSTSGSHLAFVGFDPFGLDGALGSEGHISVEFLFQQGYEHFVGIVHGLEADIRDSD